VRTCPRCGEEVAENAKFCPECGEALAPRAAPREERKVVTVVFCDLVGSTAKAEQLDPEDVRALLSSYHERVRVELERFGGTVEKFIGDAVMAVFGAPVTHEDDPERAVRAALAVRDAAIQDGAFQVRIAVHTGEALVAVDARPAEGEAMVAGDVVNTAARLQSAAPENGVLVGDQTYRATERVIEYREHEPVPAKGKAEPVRTWEAVQARSRFGVDLARASRAPLVGRDRELALLVGLLERVKAERAPQLVTLVGVPGIGKSRLLAELFAAVERSEDLVSWRQGRSLPYGDGVSYWALGEMVKAQAGVLETDEPAEAEAKLRAAVDALVRTRPTPHGCTDTCVRSRASAGATRSATAAKSRLRHGGGSSRRSPKSGRSSSSSRICTGQTRGCSTSSITSSTGSPTCRCLSSRRRVQSC
jgi:class 3 adenylate cyclase